MSTGHAKLGVEGSALGAGAEEVVSDMVESSVCVAGLERSALSLSDEEVCSR